jgi:hypothetical protein
MKKENALILLTIFDIFSFFVLWLGFHEIHTVVIDISNSSDSVSFINRIGFTFLAVVVPLAHIFMIFEYFHIDKIKKNAHLINKAIYTIFIVLFAASIFISAYLKIYVENAGYHYCSQASGVSALSRTLVYTKDEETCIRLAEEKRR